jgi:hypothetical protein
LALIAEFVQERRVLTHTFASQRPPVVGSTAHDPMWRLLSRVGRNESASKKNKCGKYEFGMT